MVGVEELTEQKLKSYRAIEKVCTAHEKQWNTSREFMSAFSHFSVKATQLQMFAFNQTIVLDPVMVNNKRSVVVNPAQLTRNMQLLMQEIDEILDQMKGILERDSKLSTFEHAFTEVLERV